MLSFFAVLSAALIGAMLAPSFRQFLNAENNKEELRTKNLEEAYFLAKQISSYGACLPSHAAWLFAAITRQINMADIPKLPEDPFSKIMTLLDWHLKAPEELKVRVNELKDEIILCCEPIAKLINDLQKNDKYLAEAIERATLASKHANEISKKIAGWTKEEKLKIDSRVNTFKKISDFISTISSKKYWKQSVEKKL